MLLPVEGVFALENDVFGGLTGVTVIDSMRGQRDQSVGHCPTPLSLLEKSAGLG